MPNRIIPVGSNGKIATSGVTYNFATTGAQPLSDLFAVPASLLALPNAWFRLSHLGSVAQGGTSQTVTLSAGGSMTGLFSPFVITTAMMPAGANYSYEFIVEWAAANTAVPGAGNQFIKFILSQSGLPAANTTVYNATFMNQTFYQAAHGNNVDAYTVGINGQIGAVGPNLFGNITKFQWCVGES